MIAPAQTMNNSPEPPFEQGACCGVQTLTTSSQLVPRSLIFGVVVLFLGACANTPPKPARVTREFDAHQISRVILRASAADTAIATTVVRDAPFVVVSGLPSGGAKGYHSPDPNWRETPASRWGLDFVSRRLGSTLVISTKGEMAYIHHRYTLESIEIMLPDPVRLTREVRKLTGDAAPDLSPP